MPHGVAMLPRDPATGYPVPYISAVDKTSRVFVRECAEIDPKQLDAMGVPNRALYDRDRALDKPGMLGTISFRRQRECALTGKCQVCGLRFEGAAWLIESYEHLTDNVKYIREPPACSDCFLYSMQVCPFLLGTRVRADRNNASFSVIAIDNHSEIATVVATQSAETFGPTMRARIVGGPASGRVIQWVGLLPISGFGRIESEVFMRQDPFDVANRVVRSMMTASNPIPACAIRFP